MNRLLEKLSQAYVGESQARNRYTMYSSIAKKEGYVQISQIFDETANHEKVHGKNYFKMMQKVMEKLGEQIDPVMLDGVGVPTMWGTTVENLKEAIAGEHHENSEMYPEIAKIAEEEGFKELSAQIMAIATAEGHHEDRYKRLLATLEKGSVFKSKDGDTWWLCIECGYWHKGKIPPKKCPSCNHSQAYFKLMDEPF